MKLLKALALLGLSSYALAGPSQPPAGNYILNVSTNASAPAFRVSSGTVTGNLRLPNIAAGSVLGLNSSGVIVSTPITGGGGGSGSGTVNSGAQYSAAVYSVVGSSSVVSASSIFKIYPSSISIGDGSSQVFIPSIGDGIASGRFVFISTLSVGSPLQSGRLNQDDIPVISSGIAFGSSGNTVTQSTNNFVFGKSGYYLSGTGTGYSLFVGTNPYRNPDFPLNYTSPLIEPGLHVHYKEADSFYLSPLTVTADNLNTNGVYYPFSSIIQSDPTNGATQNIFYFGHSTTSVASFHAASMGGTDGSFKFTTGAVTPALQFSSTTATFAGSVTASTITASSATFSGVSVIGAGNGEIDLVKSDGIYKAVSSSVAWSAGQCAIGSSSQTVVWGSCAAGGGSVSSVNGDANSAALVSLNMLPDCQVTTSSFTITVAASPGRPCNLPTTSGTPEIISSSVTASLINASTSTNGLVRVSASAAGVIVFDISTSITYTSWSVSVGTGLAIASASPVFLETPLAEVTKSSSGFVSCGTFPNSCDKRVIIGGQIMPVEGTGIDITAGVISVDTAVAPLLGIGNTYTGANDYSAGSMILPRGNGAPASASCDAQSEVGTVYTSSTSSTPQSTFYVCGSTGTASYGWELAGYAPPVTVTISSGTGFNGQTIPVWRVPAAVTITKILAESLPAGTTVLYQLDERAFGSVNTAGTNVFSVAFSTANNTGVTTTSFSNPGIATDASLVLTTPAAAASSGSPSLITFTIFYKRDL